MTGVNRAVGAGPVLPAAAAGSKASGSVSSSGFAAMFRKAVSGSSGSLDKVFEEASERYGVPLNLLKAVAKAESGFQADAVSSCGAQGIMQLMPSTARSLGVEDAFDPEQNVMGGAKYLSGLLDRYKDPKLALAAYNAGSGNVEKYGGIPPFRETRNYVEKVMGYAGEDVSIPDSPSSGTASGVPQLSGITGTVGGGFGGISFTEEDYSDFLRLLAQQLEQSALDAASNSAGAGDEIYGAGIS